MEAKKPISLTVFGILSIGCGLFILSKFAFQLLSRPLAELEYTLDKVSYLLYVFSLIFPPALVAGFIVSGVGVIQGKLWSRYLLLLTTGFGLWGLEYRLILLGPYNEECFYIIWFVMGAIFIWFFNRKPVRTVFPYRKGLKVLNYLGGAFFETGNWFSAKQHLEKAMSFQPDYPEAQQLLNEVKSKAISKKEFFQV